MSDVRYDDRPEPDANTSDITSYLFTKNLTRDKPPLTSPTAQTAAQPPPPPPDHTGEFPPYQAGQVPPALRQIDPMAIVATRPDDRYTDPTEAINIFKNPAFVLAGLASMLTRAPITTALNAGAAAMKGFHQGQMDVFQQNKDKFDQNLKAAMEQNQVELRRYNDAWKRTEEFNWEKVAPKMYEEAARNGDVLLTQALNSHNWELVEKILLGREQASNAYDKTLETMEARDRANQAQIDRWTQDPGIIARVKQIRALQAPAPPQSSRNPQNQAIWQMLAEPDPETGQVYNITDFTKRAGALQILSKPTSTNQGGRAIALNASTRHLQELDALIDALNLGNLKLANDVSIELRRQNGYPEITNYEIGADIASKEVVKAIVPGGGSAGERNAMETSLAADHGPKALHSAADTLRGFLSKQYSALNDWATEMKVKPELDKMAGPASKLGDEKPTPTAADRKWARDHPETIPAFKQHFGVEP